MSKILLMTLDNDDKLIEFNLETFEWNGSDEKKSELSSGYSDVYLLKDGAKQLIFLASFNSKLFFYCGKLYDVSDNSLNAKLSYHFFYRHFVLKQHSNTVVDIKYRGLHLDPDIIEEFIELISLKDNELKKERIDRLIRFYSEHDMQKRMDIGYEREELSLMQKLKEFFR